jgi:uncharacterized protein DUF6602
MTNSSAVPEYTKWLASSISRYEELAKSIIAHRPEKGRIVEAIVKSSLRTILPGRVSIGTGFAITSSGRISPQLDLVIYDALNNAPITLEGGTGLFPIECIYGFVEVKSVLNLDAIQSATKSINTIRSFGGEKKYVSYRNRDIGEGRVVVEEVTASGSLPPRSFIFAITSDYGSARAIEDQLKSATVANGAFIHGLAVIENDWFIHQVAYQEAPTFIVTEGRALPLFARRSFMIQSMQILPASMRQYLNIR